MVIFSFGAQHKPPEKSRHNRVGMPPLTDPKSRVFGTNTMPLPCPRMGCTRTCAWGWGNLFTDVRVCFWFSFSRSTCAMVSPRPSQNQNKQQLPSNYCVNYGYVCDRPSDKKIGVHIFFKIRNMKEAYSDNRRYSGYQACQSVKNHEP